MPRSVNQDLKADVEWMIKYSPLPKWMIPVITAIAYEKGHAYGEDEVNGYTMDWLNSFEEAYLLDKRCPKSLLGLGEKNDH